MAQKKNDEYVTVLVGSGRNSIFVKVRKGKRVLIGSGSSAMFSRAGENHNIDDIDRQLNKIVSKYHPDTKSLLEKPKQKIKSLFKK